MSWLYLQETVLVLLGTSKVTCRTCLKTVPPEMKKLAFLFIVSCPSWWKADLTVVSL